MSRWNKLLQSVVGLSIIAVSTGGMLWYWHYEQVNPATDDAYVKANVIDIAPEISGRVTAVNIKDHQFVERGQVLFTIDDAPYQIKVTNAEANIALARQKADALVQSVAVAASNQAKRHAEVVVSEKEYSRIHTLVEHKRAALADEDSARARRDQATAALRMSDSEFELAKAYLGHTGEANANVLRAKAELEQAKLDLSHTKIVAPASGRISHMTLRPGAIAKALSPQFALVDNSEWWIEANFKETQLQVLRPGQPVDISIDMYPGQVFHGHISSISRGSGASFALLPPENASGNWVKVTQRFPVRISIDDAKSSVPLMLGASAHVRVHS